MSKKEENSNDEEKYLFHTFVHRSKSVEKKMPKRYRFHITHEFENYEMHPDFEIHEYVPKRILIVCVLLGGLGIFLSYFQNYIGWFNSSFLGFSIGLLYNILQLGLVFFRHRHYNQTTLIFSREVHDGLMWQTSDHLKWTLIKVKW